MTMTYHAREERHDRIFIIKKYIGLGNPIKKIPATTKKSVGAMAVLTDTGIIIVRDKHNTTIITMIVPDFDYVKKNFYPDDMIPWEMQLAISRNKKYIQVIEAIEAQ